MCITVSKLVAEFTRWATHNLSPRTIDYYSRYLIAFAAYVGETPVDELRPHSLISWSDCRHKTRSVQRLFNWACGYAELIQFNPFRKIKLQRQGQRRRVLTRPELCRMLRAAQPNFRAFLLAMRETIARPQEIRALRWDDLQWNGQHRNAVEAIRAGVACFVLWDYKGRDRRTSSDEPRVLFISPRLRRLLLRLARRQVVTDGPIFRNRCGESWSVNATRCAMRRLRRSLGWGADLRGEMVCCYTLRHSMATLAAAAGVRDRVLADIMGHVSTRMTARYQHLSAEHLAEAMGRFWERKRPALTAGRDSAE